MLEEIKAKLKDLSPEEMEELKALLLSDTSKEEEPKGNDEDSNKEPETKPDGDVPTEENTDKDVPAVTPEETGDESIPAEETTPNDADSGNGEDLPPKDEDTSKDEESNADEEQGQGTPPIEDDDIPKMEKVTEPTTDEDALPSSEQITADDGEKLPVDYAQIIDGLNAKVTALESENASLKAKVDGAFGYSAKPTVPVKNNRLYDDCSDIMMHR